MGKSGLRSNAEKSDELISFLNSDEFSELISNIVQRETTVLQTRIEELRNEVVILKESNIQLIHLLTSNNAELNVINEKNNRKPTTYTEKKPISYAEKIKMRSDEKNTEQTRINNTNLASKSNKKIESVRTMQPDVPPATVNWTVVKNKRRRNNQLDIIKGTSKDDSEIKGVAKYHHFHVYRLEPSMTTEKLVNYIKSKNISEVTCDKLSSKYPDVYSSFKVSVPETFASQVTLPETWPEGVCVNRFLVHLSVRKQQT